MLNFPLTLALSRRGREDWVASQMPIEIQIWMQCDLSRSGPAVASGVGTRLKGEDKPRHYIYELS